MCDVITWRVIKAFNIQTESLQKTTVSVNDKLKPVSCLSCMKIPITSAVKETCTSDFTMTEFTFVINCLLACFVLKSTFTVITTPLEITCFFLVLHFMFSCHHRIFVANCQTQWTVTINKQSHPQPFIHNAISSKKWDTSRNTLPSLC